MEGRGEQLVARLVRGQGDAAEFYLLSAEVTTIGRAPDNTIVLTDAAASRRHAQIHREGHQYILSDLGSRNGTLVNGRRLEGPWTLEQADEILIGDTLLRFEDPNATAPSRFTAIELDEAAGRVRAWGKTLLLTAKEYTLLALLLRRRGALITRDEIAREVWPEYSGEVSDENIDNLIKRVRDKTRPPDGSQPLVRTERGRGYRLVQPGE